MHKKIVLALALSLNVPTFASTQKESKPIVSQENPFTTERNAAISSLSTTIVMMQKMARGCGTPSNKDLLNSQISKWQEKNKPFLIMHSSYIQGMVASLKSAEGEKEATNLLNSLKKLSNDEANTAIKTIIEKEGKEAACKKYFSLISAGDLDIKQGFPNYKILKEMLEYSKSKTQKTK